MSLITLINKDEVTTINKYITSKAKENNYKPVLDNEDRLVYYLGQKVTYKNLGNIDDCLEEDWLKEINDRNELVDANTLLANLSSSGYNYSTVEISKDRLETICAFEDSLYSDDKTIGVFKIDITDMSQELGDSEFKSLTRLFDTRRRWSELLKEKVDKRVYCIECGDNGCVGTHLWFIMDISNYYNTREKNKWYRDQRNYIVKTIIDMMKEHGVVFNRCLVNVSECIPNSLVSFKKSDISLRNCLRVWLSYSCKINSMTRAWLMEKRKKLFSVSYFE